jgi:magnesium transporter
VVVAGVYGMNFDRIPLAHHPYGFEIMVVIQLGLGAVLVMTLKRLKWL